MTSENDIGIESRLKVIIFSNWLLVQTLSLFSLTIYSFPEVIFEGLDTFFIFSWNTFQIFNFWFVLTTL